MKAILISVAFLTVLISPRVSLACVCAASATPCGSFYAADAVLVGMVSRVENKTVKADLGEVIAGQTAYVQVEESFKGVKRSEMIFRSYGSSCDPQYKEGERWLFYAYFNKDQKAWEIHPCDRSVRIERAADDLLYLRNLVASAQETRIAGVLHNITTDEPMLGIKVKVTDGRQVYEAFTDKNGVYEILGLPPGKYSVEPEVPFTMKVNFSSAFGELPVANLRAREITLAEKSCAGMNFYFTETTSVSGKIFSADGRPLKGVCVTLISKDPKAKSLTGTCTKADGSFNLDAIPLGEYLLVANEDGQITSKEPFPAVYYPGVLDKDKAAVLTFAIGDGRPDINIHIPSEQPVWTIEGTLLFADGRPVADESVWFNEETQPHKDGEEVTVRTDSNGRFSLTVLGGLKGSLRGQILSYRGEYKNCPMMEKFIRSEEDIVDLFTNVIKLETNTDYKDLELRFPFPYCAKTKPAQR
jgi:hypothetical protein